MNRRATHPIVAPGGPVVSLTSHGQRIDTVYLGIESIGLGSVRPSRVILWLDDRNALASPPTSLVRLQERGLELRESCNFGPHTKYYPYLTTTGVLDAPLVTADDDILYPSTWLQQLVDAHTREPHLVHCHRAHVIGVHAGQLAKYASWEPCRNTHPSHLHFATGVSGVIYPPKVLRGLRESATGFREVCPRADDIWLNVHALRTGCRVNQLSKHPVHFPTVPRTQAGGLLQDNWLGGGNDEQLRQTYGPADLRALVAELQSAN